MHHPLPQKSALRSLLMWVYNWFIFYMYADHMRKSIKKPTNYEMLLATIIAVEKLGKRSFTIVKENRIFEQTRSFLNSLLIVFYFCGPTDTSKLQCIIRKLWNSIWIPSSRINISSYPSHKLISSQIKKAKYAMGPRLNSGNLFHLSVFFQTSGILWKGLFWGSENFVWKSMCDSRCVGQP